MFDKEKLRGLLDTKIEKVECPEWGEEGGHIYVRSMTGRSRDNYEMSLHEVTQVPEAERSYDMRAMMAVACCCDKDGNLLFEKSDVEWLTKKNVAPLDRIFDAAKRLSRMRPEDVLEMEKSLEAAQS